METAVVRKTAKLIRLLGSPEDGEALGAARGLQRTLESAGSSLHELAERVETSLVTAREAPRYEGFQWRTESPMRSQQMVAEILEQRALLRDREAEFVWSIDKWLRRGAQLTPKQRAWLEVIYERVVSKRWE